MTDVAHPRNSSMLFLPHLFYLFFGFPALTPSKTSRRRWSVFWRALTCELVQCPHCLGTPQPTRKGAAQTRPPFPRPFLGNESALAFSSVDPEALLQFRAVSCNVPLDKSKFLQESNFFCSTRHFFSLQESAFFYGKVCFFCV